MYRCILWEGIIIFIEKMYRVCKESHVRQIAIVYRTHLQYGKLHFPSLPLPIMLKVKQC